MTPACADNVSLNTVETASGEQYPYFLLVPEIQFCPVGQLLGETAGLGPGTGLLTLGWVKMAETVDGEQ